MFFPTKLFPSRAEARVAVLLLLLAGCRREAPVLPPTVPPNPAADEIIRIPVVVHVLYGKDELDVSDEKIASQLAVLNQDYRKRNADRGKTPAEFAPRAADAGIEFYLATRDPQGKFTSGITRTFTTVTGWDGKTPGSQQPVEEMELYSTAKGGHDAWPADRYLNVWIAEMSTRSGEAGLAGYAQMPGGDPRSDGVVIDPRAFGTLPPLVDAHRLGRTATHEVGHWLNLLHVFVNNQCESADGVDDTPAAAGPYTGNPAYPQYSCGQSSMFMNFMDWVDDGSMYLFTNGQRERMRAVFAVGGGRRALYEHIYGK
jgi:hypothetical protein